MGWTGFQGAMREGAAEAATTDLINILDTVEVPIVVVRRDLTIAGFNKAAADVLGVSPSDMGRAPRDVPVLAGLPRLDDQCGQVITAGVESRADFRDRDKWFVVRIAPYTRGDRRIDGAVLTFTNVTAFRASVDQAIYEREFTKTILNTVTDPLVVLSADQRIQSGNRAFYAMFGLSRDDAQGTSLYTLGNSAFDIAPLRMQLKEMLAGGHTFQPVEIDHVFTVRGERTLTLDARTLSLRGHSERRVLVTFQDITERKQAEAAKDLRSEEELRRREAKIQRLVEANVVGIVMWTLDGAINEANDAFLQMVQYDREDITSSRVRWTDLTPPEWRPRDERALVDLKAAGIFQPFEKEYLRKDGSRVPVFIGGALLEGSGNEGVAFVLDLSGQKRAEEEVLKSEERTRLMLDEALDAVVTMDADGVTTGWNKQAEVIFGWAREEAVGRHLSDMIVPAQHREAHERGLRHFLRTGKGAVLNRRIEMTALARDGREFPVELSVTPLKLDKTWTFSAFIRDISEKKRAEEALLASERDLGAIINTIPILAWSARPDGSCDFLNQRWLDYAGLTAEQARGWGWGAAIHPDDVKGLVDYWQTALASGQLVDVEARMRHFDGEYRWFLFRANPLRDAAGNIVKWYGTNTDIEDRRRAEEALRASERNFRLIVDSVPGLVCTMSAAGEIELVNRQILEYFGKSTEEIKGWGNSDAVHPDDIARVRAAFTTSIQTGRPYEIEHRCRRADGIYRWFHVRALPVRDEQGSITGWYVLLSDIDDRKRAEEALRTTEARLSRATQIATVGELSASIAHEINQPLAAVVASAQACVRFLSAQPPNVGRAHEAAESIVRDGKEAGEVVRRIRALFKRAAIENAMLNLNDVIGEVLRLLASEVAKRQVAVEADLKQDLPLVPGDRVQLQQVLLNLLLNGIEAMDSVHDRSRKLTVRTTQESPETVLVEIRDNGVGLENPDKVFEAFVTTKHNGMGMGLTICRSIVEAHNGRLWAASAEGPGATFCFALPVRLSAES
jgi:PAS domain S-box-containing protein